MSIRRKKNLARVEREIADIRSGKRLYSFIAERMETYKNYLSIISLIRKDFETLSTRLREFHDSQSHADVPGGMDARHLPIERIILYIDDLDRCQAGKVVDVLQAVHLLLAFDLFVVVVGVDPIWVINLLCEPYRAFVPEDEKEKLRPSALDPIDYLDKIFQIPYSFPRKRGGLDEFMRSLAERRDGPRHIEGTAYLRISPVQMSATGTLIPAGASGATPPPTPDQIPRTEQKPEDESPKNRGHMN